MTDGGIGGPTLRLGSAASKPKTWKQALKFGLVGGSGYLINLGVFALLAGQLGVRHTVAALAAFAVAVTNNFLWNRYWTFGFGFGFGFGSGEGQVGFQAVRFFVVSIASLGANLIVLEALLRDHAVGELTAQAIAVAAAMPLNFLGNKLWAFA